MSGLTYEISDRNNRWFKHSFDYDFCKRKYEEYANMDIEEFSECLKTRSKLGEIGHLCCFILWVKNKEQYEYRQTLGDYGLIHLLFHCVESKNQAKRIAPYIHQLFKEDIKLA